MTEEADLLHTVTTVLEQMGVPYMIGGSVALGVWAVPRMTHDIDIVVDLPLTRIAEFCAHFPPDRYYLDAEFMAAAFRQRGGPSGGMYSFIDMATQIKVDLFPLRPGDPAQVAALARRRREEVLEGQTAAVYAPDDLLVQKLRWYALGESERQFRDCLNLLLTDLWRPTPLIDGAYIEGWAAQLGPAVRRAWATLQAAVAQARAAAEPHHPPE
ncbi:MAG TPA: hypothetical protein VKY74_09745 [Chloroflexia bacterium]|nr:hypothetical protein [Chloroflexia bacterium]